MAKRTLGDKGLVFRVEPCAEDCVRLRTVEGDLTMKDMGFLPMIGLHVYA